ncbi:hypothetical protein NFI96_024152, partial [Prochilodus magdalenae]
TCFTQVHCQQVQQELCRHIFRIYMTEKQMIGTVQPGLPPRLGHDLFEGVVSSQLDSDLHIYQTILSRRRPTATGIPKRQ